MCRFATWRQAQAKRNRSFLLDFAFLLFTLDLIQGISLVVGTGGNKIRRKTDSIPHICDHPFFELNASTCSPVCPVDVLIHSSEQCYFQNVRHEDGKMYRAVDVRGRFSSKRSPSTKTPDSASSVTSIQCQWSLAEDILALPPSELSGKSGTTKLSDLDVWEHAPKTPPPFTVLMPRIYSPKTPPAPVVEKSPKKPPRFVLEF